MDKEIFNALYQEALIKAAIGVHIIKTVGAEAGISPDIRSKNITTLCTELANGVGLDYDIVYEDVISTHENFPVNFFYNPEVVELTTNLTGALARQNLLGLENPH